MFLFFHHPVRYKRRQIDSYLDVNTWENKKEKVSL